MYLVCPTFVAFWKADKPRDFVDVNWCDLQCRSHTFTTPFTNNSLFCFHYSHIFHIFKISCLEPCYICFSGKHLINLEVLLPKNLGRITISFAWRVNVESILASHSAINVAMNEPNILRLLAYSIPMNR